MVDTLNFISSCVHDWEDISTILDGLPNKYNSIVNKLKNCWLILDFPDNSRTKTRKVKERITRWPFGA